MDKKWKMLVISDTHGNMKKVKDISKIVGEVDLVVHCGDYLEDASVAEEIFATKVVAVSGNCDDPNENIKFQIVDFPLGKMLVTHGDKFDVNYSLTRLLLACKEYECNLVCFGHTHVPLIDHYDGVHIVNPGSLVRPRDGSNGSYAIVTIHNNSINCNLVYYDTVCSDVDKGVKVAGKLRDMINYSDRF